MPLMHLIRNPVKVWARLNYELNRIRRLPPKLLSRAGQPDIQKSVARLEKILIHNILTFWYPQIIDRENGGYFLNHNHTGNWKGKANKLLVNQARTVWFFSYLSGTPYGAPEHLEAARHGYNFLYNNLWDSQCGGFYWEVDSTGKTATKPDKHLYGQAFGLYALSEYALASGDESAKLLAHELFKLLETYAHDSQYGGYKEFFHRDWQLPSEAAKDYRNNASPTIKTQDTHLHLLEALTPYYRLTKEPLARERLLELIMIQANTVLRKWLGASTDRHQFDWTPFSERRYERVNYGHDLENIWLLTEACNAIGLPNALFMDLYRTLFDYALKYGFDKKNGGFYQSGRCNAPADWREKLSWVQAEALVAALQMYCRTGEELYYNCFEQTLHWIEKYQADWSNGDWHEQIAAPGQVKEDKAGLWQSPYHNGRAMIKCLALLEKMNQ